jgi:tRNA 2-selenouridine synthase
MFQDIEWEKLIELRDRKDVVLVDVRSPSEYEDATIPGSLNIPLFDDRERAEVGTLYAQVGVQAAKERGLEIVSAKLPAFVKSFAQLPGDKAVFCWRGGMRSRTTATVLGLMGIRALRLVGGYRAYRRWVVDSLANLSFKPKAFVLHGHTGTGKTAVLKALKERGHPVLDLEAMAGHRGSIFGHIGLKANNQKTFDALLLDELLRYRNAPYVLFEAESSRIGKVTLPQPFVDVKDKGHQIWLEVPTEVRIRNILEDYRPWENQSACLEAFRRIKSRIHTPVAAETEACLMEGKFDRAVELLLLYYYDPRYTHTSEQYDPSCGRTDVAASTVEEAVAAIERILRAAPVPA